MPQAALQTQPAPLTDALAAPEGRALLIDLIALRSLAQPDDVVPVAIRPPARRSRPAYVAIGPFGVVCVVMEFGWPTPARRLQPG